MSSLNITSNKIIDLKIVQIVKENYLCKLILVQKLQNHLIKYQFQFLYLDKIQYSDFDIELLKVEYLLNKKSKIVKAMVQ